MKKIISISICLFITGILYAINVSNYVVMVDTNGVVARNEYAGRRSLKIFNDGSATVYLATAPVTMDTYQTVGSYPIRGGEEYVDSFYVYKSTWYVTTGVLTENTTLYIEVKD